MNAWFPLYGRHLNEGVSYVSVRNVVAALHVNEEVSISNFFCSNRSDINWLYVSDIFSGTAFLDKWKELTRYISYTATYYDSKAYPDHLWNIF